MYVVFGESRAGIIPLSYSVFSIASIVYFGITRRFRIFRFSQLILILVLPFALMLSLGGFVGGKRSNLMEPYFTPWGYAFQ